MLTGIARGAATEIDVLTLVLDRGLAGNILAAMHRAVLVHAVKERVELQLPRLIPCSESERNWDPEVLRQLAQPVLLNVQVCEVLEDFKEPASSVCHAGHQRGQLRSVSVRAWDDSAVEIAVEERARGGQSDRAGLHRLCHNLTHMIQIFRGRRVVAAVAHHVDAQGHVREQHREVAGRRVGTQRFQIFWEALPRPLDALVQRAARYVFDSFEHLDQFFARLGLAGREADTAAGEAYQHPHNKTCQARHGARMGWRRSRTYQFPNITVVTPC